MKTRCAWLALISLAVLLAGCRVTVHGGLVRLAPSSLVGYSVMLTNSTRSGPWVSERETYHFKSTRDAFNSTLNRARSWSYHRDDHETATVSITFELPNFDDARITCVLTFESHQNGTHECEYEEITSTMLGDRITQAGSSSGTFDLVEIGQSV